MTDIANAPTSASAAPPADIVGRYRDVANRVTKAAEAAGRSNAAVTLIAVSKTFEAAEIHPVLAAGHRHFGENRVQEAKAKWPALVAEFPGTCLHLIGPLQSNKAAEAVALFDAIHTVDRPKIATTLAAEMVKQGRSLPVFIQVNTGKEPQKAGVDPEETAGFLAACRTLGLEVVGLMCIPPVDEEAAIHFAFLAKMARELGLESVSMGMSGDYETAISFGATHVRVGSSIFGARG